MLIFKVLPSSSLPVCSGQSDWQKNAGARCPGAGWRCVGRELQLLDGSSWCSCGTGHLWAHWAGFWLWL